MTKFESFAREGKMKKKYETSVLTIGEKVFDVDVSIQLPNRSIIMSVEAFHEFVKFQKELVANEVEVKDLVSKVGNLVASLRLDIVKKDLIIKNKDELIFILEETAGDLMNQYQILKNKYEPEIVTIQGKTRIEGE